MTSYWDCFGSMIWTRWLFANMGEVHGKLSYDKLLKLKMIEFYWKNLHFVCTNEKVVEKQEAFTIDIGKILDEFELG